MTIALLLGWVNVCAGLMTVAGLLTFFGGFIRYLILLGTERRKEGIAMMYWGITILFVLVILIGIVDILQGPFFFLFSIAAILFIVFLAVVTLAKRKSGGEEH